ncbi:MAG: methyltransferase domain-containing protein [Candidatus Omnitrophica bacterium]|nr:methyltransferase domain-containing protein [Candidatus Omnitrophota bacterium]
MRAVVLKICSLLTLNTFLVTSAAWPGPTPILSLASSSIEFEHLNLAKFSIPHDLGTIEELFKGSAEKPSVIFIQDAHAVFDAQKSTAGLIGHFQKNYGLNLVALEGGRGRLDPLLFRTFPDYEIKRTVFEKYLRKGEISGAEFAAILNEQKSEFWGVEDMELYERNKAAYLRSEQARQGIEHELNRLRRALDELKREWYTEDLKSLDNLIFDFKNDHGKLAALLAFLGKYQPPDAFPSIKKLLEVTEKDFQVKKEQLLAELAAEDLFAEVETYIQNVRDELLPSENVRELALLYDRLDLLTEFVSHQMTRHAFAMYRKDRMFYQPSIFQAYLEKNGKFLDLEWDLEAHEEFYAIALRRDEALIRNFKKLLGETGEGLAVFIAGGFHSEGILRRLKEEGISYALIMPRIDSVDEESPYQAVLRGEVSYGRFLNRQRDTLAPPVAIIDGAREFRAFRQAAGLNLARMIDAEHAGEIFTSWHDDTIRALAEEGRISKSPRYTGFVKALFNSSRGKRGGEGRIPDNSEIEEEVEKVLEKHTREPFTRFKEELISKVTGYGFGSEWAATEAVDHPMPKNRIQEIDAASREGRLLQFKNMHRLDLLAEIRTSIEMLRKQDEKRPLRILDLGTGAQMYLLRIVKEEFGDAVEGIGVDSEDSVGAPGYRQGDANEILNGMQRSKEKFDVILSHRAFAFFSDPLGALDRVKAILEPGGWASIHVMKPENILSGGADALTDWVQDPGFEVRKVTGLYFFEKEYDPDFRSEEDVRLDEPYDVFESIGASGARGPEPVTAIFIRKQSEIGVEQIAPPVGFGAELTTEVSSPRAADVMAGLKRHLESIRLNWSAERYKRYGGVTIRIEEKKLGKRPSGKKGFAIYPSEEFLAGLPPDVGKELSALKTQHVRDSFYPPIGSLGQVFLYTTLIAGQPAVMIIETQPSDGFRNVNRRIRADLRNWSAETVRAIGQWGEENKVLVFAVSDKMMGSYYPDMQKGDDLKDYYRWPYFVANAGLWNWKEENWLLNTGKHRIMQDALWFAWTGNDYSDLKSRAGDKEYWLDRLFGDESRASSELSNLLDLGSDRDLYEDAFHALAWLLTREDLDEFIDKSIELRELSSGFASFLSALVKDLDASGGFQKIADRLDDFRKGSTGPLNDQDKQKIRNIVRLLDSFYANEVSDQVFLGFIEKFKAFRQGLDKESEDWFADITEMLRTRLRSLALDREEAFVESGFGAAEGAEWIFGEVNKRDQRTLDEVNRFLSFDLVRGSDLPPNTFMDTVRNSEGKLVGAHRYEWAKDPKDSERALAKGQIISTHMGIITANDERSTVGNEMAKMFLNRLVKAGFKRVRILNVSDKGLKLWRRHGTQEMHRTQTTNGKVMYVLDLDLEKWQERASEFAAAGFGAAANRPLIPEDFGREPYEKFQIGGRMDYPLTEAVTIQARKIQMQDVPLDALKRFSLGESLTFQIVPMGAKEEGDRKPARKQKGVAAPSAGYLLQIWFDGKWFDLDDVPLEDGVPIVIKRSNLPESLDPILQKDLEANALFKPLARGRKPARAENRIAIFWNEGPLVKTVYLPSIFYSGSMSRGVERTVREPAYDLNTGEFIKGYLQTGHVEVKIFGGFVNFSDLGSKNGTQIEVSGEWLTQARYQMGEPLTDQAERGNVPSSRMDILDETEGIDVFDIHPNHMAIFSYWKPFYAAAILRGEEIAKVFVKVENGLLYVRAAEESEWVPIYSNQYIATQAVRVAGQESLSEIVASQVTGSYQIHFDPASKQISVFNHAAGLLRVVFEPEPGDSLAGFGAAAQLSGPETAGEALAYLEEKIGSFEYQKMGLHDLPESDKNIALIDDLDEKIFILEEISEEIRALAAKNIYRIAYEVLEVAAREEEGVSKTGRLYQFYEQLERIAVSPNNQIIGPHPGVGVEGMDVDSDAGEAGFGYRTILADLAKKISDVIRAEGTFAEQGFDKERLAERLGMGMPELRFQANELENLWVELFILKSRIKFLSGPNVRRKPDVLPAFDLTQFMQSMPDSAVRSKAVQEIIEKILNVFRPVHQQSNSAVIVYTWDSFPKDTESILRIAERVGGQKGQAAGRDRVVLFHTPGDDLSPITELLHKTSGVPLAPGQTAGLLEIIKSKRMYYNKLRPAEVNKARNFDQGLSVLLNEMTAVEGRTAGRFNTRFVLLLSDPSVYRKFDGLEALVQEIAWSLAYLDGVRRQAKNQGDFQVGARHAGPTARYRSTKRPTGARSSGAVPLLEKEILDRIAAYGFVAGPDGRGGEIITFNLSVFLRRVQQAYNALIQASVAA